MKSHLSKFNVPFWLCLLLAGILSTSGCKSKTTQDDDDENDIAVVYDVPDPLTVLIVGDSELGSIITRQWGARREGVLTVVDQSLAEFEESGYKLGEDIDVVIYPPELLGDLAYSEQLQPMPDEVFASDEFGKRGVLRHFRLLVMRHADLNYGVPLGGPCFSMLCNTPLFEKAGLEPPSTWGKIESSLRAVEKVIESDPELKLEAKVDMPLSKGWAAHTFLARSAPGIAERGKLSTVFDRRTMEPLITQIPFVESLEQLKAIASKRSLELDPKQIYDLACLGESVLGMGWPAKGFADSSDEENQQDTAIDLQILSLPGLDVKFDSKNGNWAKRASKEVYRVDTIGYSGLMGSVASASFEDVSAWDFLAWLSSKQISLVALTDQPAVGPFRASQLGDTIVWTGDAITEDIADQYAEVISANHERNQAMMFPRIPQRSKYFDVLDQAVRDCVEGKLTAEEALQNAAKEWDKITDSVGREAQIERIKETRSL